MQVAPRGTAVVTQVVVISFLVYGFLVSCLWTRIYYGPLQALSDSSLLNRSRRQLRESRREAPAQKESKEKAESVALGFATNEIHRPATAPGSKEEAVSYEPPVREDKWPSDLQSRVDKFISSQPDWDVDTAAELFRQAREEAAGKRLEGELLLELVINLRVRSIKGEPMRGPVTFLLHPSFTESVITVAPKRDRAEMKISVGEWFTVVAIADQGMTVLSYDLRNLPGAPEWFK